MPMVAGIHGNGLGENDGQHAAEIDLDGNVGGLTTVHFPANHTLGILDRHFPLRIGDKDDENNQQQHAHHQEGNNPRVHHDGAVDLLLRPVGHVKVGSPVLHTGHQRHDHVGDTGDDTGKQDDRNTVAHAELCDLFAQPHQENCASREGDHDHHSRPNTFVGQQTIAPDQGIVSPALE